MNSELMAADLWHPSTLNASSEALADNSSNYSYLDPCSEVRLAPDYSAELEAFTFVLNNIVLTAIVVLGFLGNGITIVVLTRRNMTTSTNCFLLALAVIDTVLLISTLFLICLKSPTAYPTYYRHIRPLVEPYVYPIGLTAQTAVIWITVSFTFERYIAVCHPLHAVRWCTLHRAKCVVAAVLGLSFVYNASRWLETRTLWMECGRGYVVAYVGMTSLGTNWSYRQTYFLWLYLPLMCLVPVTFLAVFNSLLVIAVRRSAKRRRSAMNVREAKENNVTIMLVSVVVVFLVCQVPALIYNVALGIDVRIIETGWYPHLNHLRNFAVTVNSAINFILYCALGQQFRKTLLQTFGSIMRWKPPRIMSLRSTKSAQPSILTSCEFTPLQKVVRNGRNAKKCNYCLDCSEDSNGKHDNCTEEAVTEVFSIK